MIGYMLSTLLLVVLCVVVYYAICWAKIIFILEDDLAEAIEVHERTVKALEAIVKTPMFFDNAQVKAAVDEAMENVKVCQTATQKLIQNFTQRSKQRYIRLIDQDEDE